MAKLFVKDSYLHHRLLFILEKFWLEQYVPLPFSPFQLYSCCFVSDYEFSLEVELEENQEKINHFK